MSAPTDVACAACGATATESFHRQRGLPTNSCLLLPTRDVAERYPRGDLDLYVCTRCGFIGNAAFDPRLAEYSAQYEETQGFSDHFNGFARTLAKRWVDQYDLHGRTVLEIGCGKGEFLEMMCEAGAARGIGIDPSARPERRTSDAASRIEWIQDLYSEAYADIEADAIVCRHTLEHIAPVGEFMRTVRAAIGDRRDIVVLFELPDVRRVLEEAAFWDVYYEHCSYFSAGSLGRLFRSTGFRPVDVSLEYDDQYLLIEARPAEPAEPPASAFPIEDDLGAVVAAARSYDERARTQIEAWRDRLRDDTSNGGRAAIWGAGSKGVAFLTALAEDATESPIELAVDINPYKHGMFMAGTGHEIVAPEALVSAPPTVVVVMNPVYLDEIGRQLDDLGVVTEVVAV